MPLISGFRSTSVWKAFFLNSIASTLVIFIAINVKSRFDKFTYKKDPDREIVRTTNWQSIVLTLISTFATSMIAFSVMYFVFGFGGGMLVNPGD